MASSSNEATTAPSTVESVVLRGIEFYSGIGGLHYGFINACARTLINHAQVLPQVVMAFDINTIANQVYETNFRHKVSPKTILSLTPSILDKYSASDLWLLSPPCQPYTRQGKQKDNEDPRAESFLKLISVILTMKEKPRRLLVENVVGFESSVTRSILVHMLQACNYEFQEFHLSPDQIAIPNSRTRYFCLASIVSSPPLIDTPDKASHIMKYIPGCSYFEQSPPKTPTPLSHYLEDRSSDVDGGKTYFESFMVPESVLIKSGMSFDIVFEDSCSSCCFTKNYGRLVEGTGSVLQMAPKDIKGVPNQPESLKQLQLRYFTPREIARIHGFPEDCDLSTATTKQAYALLGNSLNVTLVTELLVYLLSWTPIEDRNEPTDGV
jgi:tRNA (cytosine38-C5)-methyltransferase